MSFLTKLFGTRTHPKCVQFSAYPTIQPIQSVVAKQVQLQPKKKRSRKPKAKLLGKIRGVTFYARKA